MTAKITGMIDKMATIVDCVETDSSEMLGSLSVDVALPVSMIAVDATAYAVFGIFQSEMWKCIGT